MEKDLVSVIIPVYNVATYLEKCIESVIAQTYENIQIILINDGSTDNSKKICEKYALLNRKMKAFPRLGIKDLNMSKGNISVLLIVMIM